MAAPVDVVFIEAARGRVPAADVLHAMRSSGPRLNGAMPRFGQNIPALSIRPSPAARTLARGPKPAAGRARSGSTGFVRDGRGGQDPASRRVLRIRAPCCSSRGPVRFNAEQGGLIGDQVASLGRGLGCIPPGSGSEAGRAAVLAELRQRSRWLLIFDNATAAADVMPWLPGSGGHVLITSRERGWAEVGTPVEVDVLLRSESIEMLRYRVPGLTAGGRRSSTPSSVIRWPFSRSASSVRLHGQYWHAGKSLPRTAGGTCGAAAGTSGAGVLPAVARHCHSRDSNPDCRPRHRCRRAGQSVRLLN